MVMFSSILGGRSGYCEHFAEANTAFALDLYGQLKSTPGNLFFSPYSISTGLTMTYAGARGDTEKQMRQVLHLESEQGKVHAAVGEFQRQLGQADGRKGIELNVANALWAQTKYPFLPAFLDIAKANYQANVNQADFVTESEKARDEINRWVAQKTQDKIKNILPPGSLTDLTRLVLANAIYFKGEWSKPFEKDETASQPFHFPDDRNGNVPLMHHFDTVGYMEEGGFQAVELPYHGGELSMVVLLPRRIEGCGELEARLTPALISRALGQMKQQRVEIFLPRFKLESGIDLNHALANLGMPDAFGPQSDFSGMDGSKWLYLSGVYHKAWGEVNEEGTEAAAATAVAVAGRAFSKPPPPPPIFRADHPFVFFIRHTRSGCMLFLGRFAEPR
jgi:serine protease inhibitor